MATYQIDIVDTVTDNHLLNLEHAERSSLKLKWEGADRKDELAIVASTLEFTLEVPVTDNRDAKFIDLFTSDEERYQVRLIDQTGGAIVWTGYLLPDSYNEPYSNGTFYVDFFAVCGLSTLKTKFLPQAYYQKEHSVIDIFKQLLLLTGAGLQNQPIELLFMPAVLNTFEQSYDKIYINGENFINDGEKQNAYEILNDLLTSMLCVCYQADFKWYVEGINWRSERLVAFERDFQRPDPRISKIYKELDAIDEPEITIVPAYGEVKVTYEPEETKLPEQLVTAEPLWQDANPNLAKLHPVHWKYIDNTVGIEEVMRHEYPSYNLVIRDVFGGNITAPYYSLFAPIYIKGGNVYTFEFELKLNGVFVEDEDFSALNDLLIYDVRINDIVVLGNNVLTTPNRNRLSFFGKEDYTASLSKDLFIPKDGLLDIRLYVRAQNNDFSDNASIEITNISFTSAKDQEVIDQEVFTLSASSVNKDIDLAYSQSGNLTGKVFQLYKQRDRNVLNFVRYNVETLSIINRYEDEEAYYYVLNNEDAFLADNYISNIYAKENVNENDLVGNAQGVVFNYLNTEEHVLVTDKSEIHTALYVLVLREPEGMLPARENALSWRDARYDNEQMSYVKAVASVYSRMFSSPYINVSATFLGAVQFNNLLNFNYLESANYMITNLTWNIDEGTSEVVMESARYGVSEGLLVNTVKPFVSIGEDIYVVLGTPEVVVVPNAFSLAGRISTYRWQVVQGDAVLASSFAVNATLRFRDDDEIVLKVVVADELGNEASDQISVFRVGALRGDFNKEFETEAVNSNLVAPNGFTYNYVYVRQFFDLIGQRLYDTGVLMLRFEYAFYYKRSGINDIDDSDFKELFGSGGFSVTKNEVKVSEVEFDRTTDFEADTEFLKVKRGSVNISYRHGDVIYADVFGLYSNLATVFEGYFYLAEATVLQGGKIGNSVNIQLQRRGVFVAPDGVASGIFLNYSDSRLSSYESRFGNAQPN